MYSADEGGGREGQQWLQKAVVTCGAKPQRIEGLAVDMREMTDERTWRKVCCEGEDHRVCWQRAVLVR